MLIEFVSPESARQFQDALLHYNLDSSAHICAESPRVLDTHTDVEAATDLAVLLNLRIVSVYESSSFAAKA
jgi:hypothetical protein